MFKSSKLEAIQVSVNTRMDKQTAHIQPYMECNLALEKNKSLLHTTYSLCKTGYRKKIDCRILFRWNSTQKKVLILEGKWKWFQNVLHRALWGDRNVLHFDLMVARVFPFVKAQKAGILCVPCYGEWIQKAIYRTEKESCTNGGYVVSNTHINLMLFYLLFVILFFF